MYESDAMSVPVDNSKTEESVESVNAKYEADTTTHPTKICWVCQQPIQREGTLRWRGKPIHPVCIDGL